ncbi:MAG: hypothetical protein U0401_23965 [Anaerolineae bacterium]
MDLASVYEIVGYIASALVAISLMMSSILKLRVINLIGAICFTAYGLLIGAYPVAVVNFIIVLIDLYFLYEMFTAKEYFTLLEVQKNSEYLEYFLNFYGQEIKKFFPNFSYNLSEQQLIFFTLRNLVPAGLFIGKIHDRDSLLVTLEFVIPGYRDFKIGEFLYSKKAQFFKAKGFRKIYSESGSQTHNRYLQKMGFVPESSENNVTLYYRTID